MSRDTSGACTPSTISVRTVMAGKRLRRQITPFSKAGSRRASCESGSGAPAPPVEGLLALHGVADDQLVASVHPVEGADGDDAAPPVPRNFLQATPALHPDRSSFEHLNSPAKNRSLAVTFRGSFLFLPRSIDLRGIQAAQPVVSQASGYADCQPATAHRKSTDGRAQQLPVIKRAQAYQKNYI